MNNNLHKEDNGPEERASFIRLLKRLRCDYVIEGERIIITHQQTAFLHTIKSIPPNIEFKNKGNVYLDSIESLPTGIIFNNKGTVNFDVVEYLPSDTIFNNEGSIHFNRLKRVPEGVEFKNGGSIIFLRGGIVIPRGVTFNNKMYVFLPHDGFDPVHWVGGNIDNIKNTRLLNVMIKRGILE